MEDKAMQPKWQAYWDEEFSEYRGAMKFTTNDVAERIDAVISSYEMVTNSKFVVWRTPKNHFGSWDIKPKDIKNRSIFWKDADRPPSLQHENSLKIEFSGTPYISIGVKILCCHQGRDKDASKKRKYALEKEQRRNTNNDSPAKSSRPRKSKKLECPVRAYIRHVIFFPDFKIDLDTKSKRRWASKKLRDKLLSGNDVSMTNYMYFELPRPDDHKFHAIGEAAGARIPVDKRIRAKIYSLYNEGVKTTAEISQHIDTYVRNELFYNEEQPSILNRRFRPTAHDIQCHMQRAKTKQQLAKETQDDDVAEHFEVWHEQDPTRTISDLTEAIPLTRSSTPDCPDGQSDDDINTTVSSLLLANKKLTRENKIRIRCRDNLKKLLDLTEHVSKEEDLTRMENVLSDLIEDMRKKIGNDVGLMVEDAKSAQGEKRKAPSPLTVEAKKQKVISTPKTQPEEKIICWEVWDESHHNSENAHGQKKSSETW